jgi:hypothetical protein
MALSRSYRWEIPRGVSRMTRNSSVAVRTLSMAQSVFEQRIVGIDVGRQLRHYGALDLRRGRALARRQIPSTWRQCTRLHFRCRRDAGIARRRQLNLQNDRGLIGTIGQKRSIAMTHMGDHVPPRAWKWNAPNGGPFASINRSLKSVARHQLTARASASADSPSHARPSLEIHSARRPKTFL